MSGGAPRTRDSHGVFAALGGPGAPSSRDALVAGPPRRPLPRPCQCRYRRRARRRGRRRGRVGRRPARRGGREQPGGAAPGGRGLRRGHEERVHCTARKGRASAPQPPSTRAMRPPVSALLPFPHFLRTASAKAGQPTVDIEVAWARLGQVDNVVDLRRFKMPPSGHKHNMAAAPAERDEGSSTHPDRHNKQDRRRDERKRGRHQRRRGR